MDQQRRVAVSLAGAAIVLIAIGVAAIVFDAGVPGDGQASIAGVSPTPTRPRSPSAVVSPTSSPSRPVGSGIPGTPGPTNTASPVVSGEPSLHTTGFVQQGTGIAYHSADGSVIPVKPVAGLEVRLERGRAIYYALSGNRYGLGRGDYAGEFIPLVTMGQPDGSSAETGGLVLTGPVVATLIADKLASIQLKEDRWIVALPVDIRTVGKTAVDVSFDQFGLAGWSNTPRVVVRFGGSMPVVEANPTNGGFHVLVEQLGVTTWQVIDPVRLTLPPGVIDPAHAMNQLLVYGDGAPSVERDVHWDHRVSVGQQMLMAAGSVSVSLVAEGSRAELGPEKVLTVDDVPVFVAAN
jgi:hypothetical protein